MTKHSPVHLTLDNTNKKWSLGLGISVLTIFVVYKYAVPTLPGEVKTVLNNWLPLTSLGEAAVFVLMALGLNIVVGYAGLLDLGYVAFWALGG